MNNAETIRQISPQDLMSLGVSHLAYLRPVEIDGQSLMRLLEVEDGSRLAFSQGPRPAGFIEKGIVRWKNEKKAHSVRKGKWKLIRTPYLDLEELYDLAADPGEQNPLECLEECADLAEDLQAIVALAASGETGRDDETVELDEQDLERLRALGYVD